MRIAAKLAIGGGTGAQTYCMEFGPPAGTKDEGALPGSGEMGFFKARNAATAGACSMP